MSKNKFSLHKITKYDIIRKISSKNKGVNSMITHEGKTFLQVSEFAKKMNMSPNTVLKWIKIKYIVFTKVGGLYFIPESEISRLLKGDKNV
jgi:excisionase family DNA binding protein